VTAVPLRRMQLRRARPLLRTLSRRAARALKPVRPAAANLASVPLTVTGLGCVDFAAYHLGHGWGWLVTGLSLMWLEHVIADET
jgi:hypothetical protein